MFAASIPLLAIGLILMMRLAMPLFKAVFKKYDPLNNSVQENVQASFVPPPLRARRRVWPQREK